MGKIAAPESAIIYYYCTFQKCVLFVYEGYSFYSLEVLAGQQFKLKSCLFQKSRADNFSPNLGATYTTRHGDSLWKVQNNSGGKCRRSCAQKKLLTDGRTDVRTYNWRYNIIRSFRRIKKVKRSKINKVHKRHFIV